MDIESVVCNLYGIKREDLINKRCIRREAHITECLHFIIYIRHYTEGLSIKTLSEKYGMTRRNVSLVSSKLKWGIENESYYFHKYRSIMEEIKKEGQ